MAGKGLFWPPFSDIVSHVYETSWLFLNIKNQGVLRHSSGHFGFCRQCRRWASAPGAARLVFVTILGNIKGLRSQTLKTDRDQKSFWDLNIFSDPKFFWTKFSFTQKFFRLKSFSPLMIITQNTHQTNTSLSSWCFQVL